jgi:hypothetical protein
MKIWRTYLSIIGGSILAAALAPPAKAQGRLFDRVVVDLPNDTYVNEQVLPAGHYEFRQVRDSAASSHIMLVQQNGGTRFDAAAITIPALNNNTPDATRVIVRRIGPSYYLDKIWVAGKDYGYQFVLPERAKNELTIKQEPITISANYQQEAPPAPPPPAVAKEQPPQPPPAPPAREEPPVIAQAQPPPPPAQPAPAPAPEPPPQRLPATSSGWAGYVLAGAFSIGLAAWLRLSRRSTPRA